MSVEIRRGSVAKITSELPGEICGAALVQALLARAGFPTVIREAYVGMQWW